MYHCKVVGGIEEGDHLVGKAEVGKVDFCRGREIVVDDSVDAVGVGGSVFIRGFHGNS